jgi:sugar O-acyltransferase (sialic acid O-acetyltransferase NeuD family)
MAGGLTVVGTGGFAQQVAGFLRKGGYRCTPACPASDVRFVSDDCDGADFLGFAAGHLADFANGTRFAIAVSGGDARRQLAERCLSSGGIETSVLAASAYIDPSAELGDGAIVCDHALVEPNVRIGRQFHANVFSFVAHECMIGDFVTFGPRAACNGNVHIGDGAYIGAGAIIRQGTPSKPLTIGEGAVIGMGAVVTRDVPAGVTVAGNPARKLSKDTRSV